MPDERPNTVYRLTAAGLEWRAVNGEVLALDLKSSEYLGVNRSGAVLWGALVDGATRDELVKRLVAAEHVEAALAERDVEQFLEQLRDHRLLAEQASA